MCVYGGEGVGVGGWGVRGRHTECVAMDTHNVYICMSVCRHGYVCE